MHIIGKLLITHLISVIFMTKYFYHPFFLHNPYNSRCGGFFYTRRCPRTCIAEFAKSYTFMLTLHEDYIELNYRIISK